MIKIFFTENPQNKPSMLFKALLLNESSAQNYLFIPSRVSFDGINAVEKPEDADIFLAPFACMKGDAWEHSYVSEWRDRAKASGKPFCFFVGGDMSHGLKFPDGAYALRFTGYKNIPFGTYDIVMPVVCDDLGLQPARPLAQDSIRKPVVSFCGWAGFPSFMAQLKFGIKIFLVDLQKLFRLNSSLEVFKKGIYFRRKSLKALSTSDKVKTSFIIRTSFSANKKTIGLDPATARAEYVENMRDSDFVLAPKGDANYSVRFYEALSMGRVPVLIDTDMILPFEDKLHYDDFIVRVPYRDISRLGDIVAEVYAKQTPESWTNMQSSARKAFEEYIRPEACFVRAFGDIMHTTQPYEKTPE